MKKLMVGVAAMVAAVFAFSQDAEIVKVKGRGVGALCDLVRLLAAPRR